MQSLDENLKEHLEGLENAVLEGNYVRAFDSLQKAKGVLHVIKAKNLWNKGNRYFALIESVKQALEAFDRKDLKKLEENLNRTENLLLGKGN